VGTADAADTVVAGIADMVDTVGAADMVDAVDTMDMAGVVDAVDVRRLGRVGHSGLGGPWTWRE